jgi:hypothetical protein
VSTETKARAACDEAMRLAFGDRQDDYGDPSESFDRISKLWTAYIGCTIDPVDVAVLLLLLKVSRCATDSKPDTWHDMIAYAAIGAALK